VTPAGPSGPPPTSPAATPSISIGPLSSSSRRSVSGRSSASGAGLPTSARSSRAELSLRRARGTGPRAQARKPLRIRPRGTSPRPHRHPLPCPGGSLPKARERQTCGIPVFDAIESRKPRVEKLERPARRVSPRQLVEGGGDLNQALKEAPGVPPLAEPRGFPDLVRLEVSAAVKERAAPGEKPAGLEEQWNEESGKRRESSRLPLPGFPRS
jgi:hypothetical protein